MRKHGGTTKKIRAHYSEKEMELAIAHAVGALGGKDLLEIIGKTGQANNAVRSWAWTRLAYAVRSGYLVKRTDQDGE